MHTSIYAEKSPTGIGKCRDETANSLETATNWKVYLQIYTGWGKEKKKLGMSNHGIQVQIWGEWQDGGEIGWLRDSFHKTMAIRSCPMHFQTVLPPGATSLSPHAGGCG